MVKVSTQYNWMTLCVVCAHFFYDHTLASTPHVIEPSFGLGRIIYSILEHSYNVREGDAQRAYLSLPPIIAPTKVSVLPLRSSPVLQPFIARIVALLKDHGISSKVDETGMLFCKLLIHLFVWLLCVCMGLCVCNTLFILDLICF
jgi:glycyl-tRNA synthetase (class II)